METRAWEGGGATPPGAPFSASFWFLPSGCSPKLCPQPLPSLRPSILFLGDCTPCSCFGYHPHSWSPVSKFPASLTLTIDWCFHSKICHPLGSHIPPKSCCLEFSLFLQRNLPPPRPGPSAGVWGVCQDLLAPSPFCTSLRPLLCPPQALLSPSLCGPALPFKPHHSGSEYSVSLLGLCPACSRLPDSTQFGSTRALGSALGFRSLGTTRTGKREETRTRWGPCSKCEEQQRWRD